MARKITAAAAALLLGASLLLFALAPRAEAVTFTVINNEILDLAADTQPAFVDGRIFVPGSIFGGSSLGVIMAQSRQQLFLYKDGKSLTFSVADDTVKDQDDNYYNNIKPKYINGRIYVPLDFVCVYFGFTFSYITSSSVAPIVRIKYGDVLSDSIFTSAAESAMRSRLSRYEESVATPTPTATATPTPTPTPMYYGDVSVFVAITGLDAEITPGLLDTLASYDARACFFLTAADMDAAPDIVRRIMGEGHTVGLLAEGEDEAGAWSAASRALLRHAVSRTLLAASLDGDGAAAEDMGLRLCFDSEADVLEADGAYGYAEASAKLLAATDTETVIIRTDEESPVALESVLELIRLGGFDVRVMLETSRLG